MLFGVASPHDLGLNALGYHVPEPDVPIRSHDKGMGITGIAGRQAGQSSGSVVKDRVVLYFDVHVHLYRPLQEMLDRTDILL